MPLPMRTFELTQAHLLGLRAIDSVNQTFTCEFFIEFTIRGGAADEDLWGANKDSDAWPESNRPSARWYLKQFECPTALAWKALDSKVYSRKSDLILQQRIQGTFLEPFELQTFPFDTQRLSLTLSLLCAREGHVPVEFAVPTGIAGQIDARACLLTLHHSYSLDTTLSLKLATAGACDTTGERPRSFPALELAAHVHRYHSYYTINVTAPMFTLVGLAHLAFALPVSEPSDRLAVSLTVVLVTAAYKLVTAGMLPPISYPTLIDYYVIGCFGIIALIAVENALLGALCTGAADGSAAALSIGTAVAIDRACLGGCLLLWAAQQAWLVLRARKAWAAGCAAARSGGSPEYG